MPEMIIIIIIIIHCLNILINPLNFSVLHVIFFRPPGGVSWLQHVHVLRLKMSVFSSSFRLNLGFHSSISLLSRRTSVFIENTSLLWEFLTPELLVSGLSSINTCCLQILLKKSWLLTPDCILYVWKRCQQLLIRVI